MSDFRTPLRRRSEFVFKYLIFSVNKNSVNDRFFFDFIKKKLKSYFKFVLYILYILNSKSRIFFNSLAREGGQITRKRDTNHIRGKTMFLSKITLLFYLERVAKKRKNIYQNYNAQHIEKAVSAAMA